MANNLPAPSAETKSPGSKSFPRRLVVFLGLAAVCGVLYSRFGGWLDLNTLAEHEESLKEFQQRHPVLVYGMAFLLYVAVTGLSLPGAAVLSLTFAWYFGAGTLAGYLRTVLLISFASTTGATVAFLLSRYLFRDAIESRFADRLSSFHAALQRDGAYYLLSLRLIPAVPFFVVNLVMGLTPMPARTFWWISQVGMLPGTAVYVFAGWSIPGLKTLAERGNAGILSPQLFIAFGLLGLFPLGVRQLQRMLNPSAATTDADVPH